MPAAPAPVRAGDALAAGFRVAEVTTRDSATRFVVTDGARHVTLVWHHAPRPERSPFPPLFYEATDVPFATLAPAGRALAEKLARAAPGGDLAQLVPLFPPDAPARAEGSPAAAATAHQGGEHPGDALCLARWALRRLLVEGRVSDDAQRAQGVFGAACAECALRSACAGVTPRHAELRGTGSLRPFRLDAPLPRAASPVGLVAAIPWQAKVRWLLEDDPKASVSLRDVMPAAEIPKVACTLPWHRLELHEGGTFGPCCAEYMSARQPAPADADPRELWNGDLMRSFRRALASDGHPSTCRRSCPVLSGGLERPEALLLQGGAAALVENQIRVVESMAAGQDEVTQAPSQLCISTTSYCNYDCLMCDCGARGTLDDQKTARFYDGLLPWLDRISLIDANGGEPLASPEFRDFVARMNVKGKAGLRFHLTTNGSYLTPAQLAKYDPVPFGALTISLNAATPETYLAVNRGLPFERIRKHLDALLELRKARRFSGTITYSMVILRQNLEEIRAFAELCVADGVEARYMLPMRNRNASSIMASREAMTEAHGSLLDVAARFDAAGMERSASGARGSAGVLEARLARNILNLL